MFNLPTQEAEFKRIMPSRLVIGSHQGTGKTVALALLPKCLVLDLESGSEGYGGTCFNLKKQMLEFNMKLKKDEESLTQLGAFRMFIASLKKANEEKGDYVYDYLAIDTMTQFLKMSEQKANSNFKRSVVGKGMAKKGEDINDVISELPDGAGYRWLLLAWDELYQETKDLVRHGTIYVAHTKQGSMLKDGRLVAAKDIDLLGKTKTDLLRDCQAAGYLYRKDPNTVVMNAVSMETDLTTKSRCSHLANKEIIFSTMNPETGELTVNWNLIYPDWIKEPIIKKVQ